MNSETSKRRKIVTVISAPEPTGPPEWLPQQKCFKVEISELESVLALKKQIEEMLGPSFPAGSQNLLLGEKVLGNDAILKECNISETNFLVLKIDKNTSIEAEKCSPYYDFYSDINIHEDMLRDKVRTLAYQNAMCENKHLLKGKVVLDIGCGTGILSMFAAKAGAKRVFAVDASNIVTLTTKIVKENNLEDVITLIHGEIEKVQLPVEKVDVIVSEWMGFCLYNEAMLQSVLYARDKWLVPGGIMFPDKASLYVCGIWNSMFGEQNIKFWEDVYGFKMTCVKDAAVRVISRHLIDIKTVMTNPYLIKEMDLYSLQEKDLSFSTPYQLAVIQDGCIDALAFYFTVNFSKCDKPIMISTAPDSDYTHWRQTVMYLKEKLEVQMKESISGEVSITPINRDLKFDVSLSFNGVKDKCNIEKSALCNTSGRY